MFLTILTFSCLTSLDCDYTSYEETLYENLLIGFDTLYTEFLFYFITETISADIESDEISGSGGEIAVFAALNGLLAFSPIIGGMNAEASINLLESTLIVCGTCSVLLIINIEGFLNESYTTTLAIWLWPVFAFTEVLTFFLRAVSLLIRITSNAVAGHIVTSLILFITVLLLEFVTYWIFIIIILFLLSLIGSLQILEFVITFVQIYVWTVMSCAYEDIIS